MNRGRWSNLRPELRCRPRRLVAIGSQVVPPPPAAVWARQVDLVYLLRDDDKDPKVFPCNLVVQIFHLLAKAKPRTWCLGYGRARRRVAKASAHDGTEISKVRREFLGPGPAICLGICLCITGMLPTHVRAQSLSHGLCCG